MNSPDFIKKIKATTNPKNNDDNCFQYVLNVTLNYGEIKRNSERVSNTVPFINTYNWTGTSYPSK